MSIDAKMIEELLDSSHTPSYDCAQRITDVLCSHLPIKACSFYSFFEETKFLTLRGQTGFDYTDYKSFELELDKLAGLAILEKKVIFRKNIKNDPTYRDKNLIRKYSLNHIIIFPLEAKECIEYCGKSVCQDFSGVICLYPKTLNQKLFSEARITKLSSLISKVYSYSMTADRLLVRNDIANTTITSTDLNSFLHKVIKLLSEKWYLEASSVFFFDRTKETMFMRATTGVKSYLKRFENTYKKNINDDDLRLTMQCYFNDEIITIVSPDRENPSGKYPEIVENEKKSEIYIPIIEPTHKGNKKEVVGVLRTVNRIVKRDSITETCCHGWEDVSLLLFVAEVIGIISHLFRRNDKIVLDFERAMHGINRPINAVKVRLNDLGRLIKQHDHYIIENSIAYIEALEWQIHKHTNRDSFKKIKLQKINLYGTVLSKIVAFIRSSYKTYNVKKINVNQLEESNFNKIPPVMGHEKALQVVFRNMVENAMKYHKRKTICDINLSWNDDVKYVYIYISDQGIGITEANIENIFQEGYRSINAMRREPSGTGIGLSDSRDIMRSMQGDLFLQNRSNPTTFVVKLIKYQ